MEKKLKEKKETKKKYQIKRGSKENKFLEMREKKEVKKYPERKK